MIKPITTPPEIQNNPLLKNIPPAAQRNNMSGVKKKTGSAVEHYKIKVSLDSIHYTGKDYGYGWTFVISILNHHWICNRIQIQRGKKSLINTDVYNNVVDITFDNLQHLPITLCAHHVSGFNVETTLYLKPNSFKKDLTPKSIYTEVVSRNEKYQFHELQTVREDGSQLMFVLNFEIIPNVTHQV